MHFEGTAIIEAPRDDFTVKNPPEEARLKVRGKGPNSFVGPVESERRRR